MPFIKKKFPTYDSFGKAAIDDIFNKNQLESSLNLKAYTFATSYLGNNGGKFEVSKMPVETQLSSVNEIIADDFDDDGHLDLLMAGNLYASEVETPRNDALLSLFLKGLGNGQFEPLAAGDSGLMTKGTVKGVQLIRVNGDKKVVFAKNDDALEIFGIR